MKYHCLHFLPVVVLISLHSLVPVTGRAQDEPADNRQIPAQAIDRMRADFDTLQTCESATETRRMSKRVLRTAEALIGQYPESPDRFVVWGIVFEMQKLMFQQRQSKENSDALLATARLLVEAPDEHADLRVEPEMMLLQIELGQKQTRTQEKALAVARFADRYRGTGAEAASLMMAAAYAFDIGNSDLLEAFEQTLATRFSDDPLVAAFMRERFGTGGEVSLRGVFERADGRRLSFPIGQTYLVCFWSLETPFLQDKFTEIQALQTRFRGQFKVFSFNLDELRDGGTAALKRMGIEDWTVMRLPGGAAHPLYGAVGGANLYAARVIGPHGLARGGPTGHSAGPLHRRFEAVAGLSRQAAVLRSLCTGDFLLPGALLPDETGFPAETIHALQACFPAPPKRYRQSLEEEFKNYETAERLCRDAVAEYPEAENLWLIRQRQIVALMGLWRLTGDLRYLDQAVASAKTVLSPGDPTRAGVITHFALTAKALVAEESDPSEELDAFVAACDGHADRGAVYAAALMLSLDAHSREQYINYRSKLLADGSGSAAAARVSAFLLDASSSASLFEPALPSAGHGVGAVPAGAQRLDIQWHSLDGEKRSPAAGADMIHALVFAELTDDRNAKALQQRVIEHLIRMAAQRPAQDLTVTAVFCSDDRERVAGIMEQNTWACNAGILRDDQWKAVAGQIGLFATDQRPNVFIIGPGGKTLLALSGVSPDTHRAETLTLRIDIALREYALEQAETARVNGDYGKCAAFLAVSFPINNQGRSRHHANAQSTSMHGRKLTWAYMQAGDWQRALQAADTNIALLEGTPDPKDTALYCRTCHGYLKDMLIRIVLLRKAGETAEAEAALAAIDPPECKHGKSIEPLWDEVTAYVNSRPEAHRRFNYLRDPHRFLAEHEHNMRAGRQNLYGFGIDSDLMMRATIHDRLANQSSAEADRRRAAVHAWPFKPREYDPGLLNEACIERRSLARKSLEAGEWQQAFELANRNIEIHEGEARRCNSMCRICWAQVQSFDYRARTLEGLGRKAEAEASRAMAQLCRCPPGKELESYKCFPVNRMYGGGSGINRLNFIDGVMTGKNSYANRQHRVYRLQLADDLVLRAQALDGLGETAESRADRDRAAALAFPLGARAAAFAQSDEGPARYEDLLPANDQQN